MECSDHLKTIQGLFCMSVSLATYSPSPWERGAAASKAPGLSLPWQASSMLMASTPPRSAVSLPTRSSIAFVVSQ